MMNNLTEKEMKNLEVYPESKNEEVPAIDWNKDFANFICKKICEGLEKIK